MVTGKMATQRDSLLKVALTSSAVLASQCLFMVRTVVTWSQFPSERVIGRNRVGILVVIRSCGGINVDDY